MARFFASGGFFDICHRDSGCAAVPLQVAPTDRIRDTTQKTDVLRPKHPCTFLRVFVRRIWADAWLEICLRPAGSNCISCLSSATGHIHFPHSASAAPFLHIKLLIAVLLSTPSTPNRS